MQLNLSNECFTFGSKEVFELKREADLQKKVEPCWRISQNLISLQRHKDKRQEIIHLLFTSFHLYYKPIKFSNNGIQHSRFHHQAGDIGNGKR